jgi:hypothetical protein
MSLPKSKVLSASKAIMSIAAAAKYRSDENVKAIQKQTVNINVNHSPAPAQAPTPAQIITTPAPTPAPPPTPVQEPQPEIIERDIILEPAQAQSHEADLEHLYSMLNNYETVAKALIMIIDLIESNPLIVNKIIVPTEASFKELVIVLTGAEDVEIRYVEDIGCTAFSKKYRFVEEIIVVKDAEAKAMKYSYPDVTRLFDRFNISTKMIQQS